MEKGENVLTLSAVEEFIPARTGVILQADKADYEFEITTADAFLENDLKGSVVSFVHNNSGYQPYTLQTSTNSPGVAFKRFVGASITGGKVYLELPSTQAAAAVRVRFAGTTEIEMPIANGQQPTAVYDLAGRRVEKMEKGIYIVNGKKIIVK